MRLLDRSEWEEIMSDETWFRLRTVAAVLVWMFVALFLTAMWLAAAGVFNRAPWACGITMLLVTLLGPSVIALFWNEIPGGKS